MRIFISALFLFGLVSAQAQLSILFVDDSTDNFSNSEILSSAIDSVGIAYTYYDADDEGGSPDLAMLESYDLVIWHTSSIDNQLFFWNGLDEVNSDIVLYLEGGGNMWVIGNDYLFDFYGSAPISFSSGDFPYDYLGLESYDVQSHADDGDTGLKQAEPVASQPINGLEIIDFFFDELWWADGVTPRTGAIPIYEMGDMDYVLAGHPTAVWYDNGTFRVLSYYFDLALASSFDLMKSSMSAVIGYFENQIVSSVSEVNAAEDWNCFPNPFSEKIEFLHNQELIEDVQVFIYNPLGQVVHSTVWKSGQVSFNWQPTSDLSNGIYLVQIKSADKSFSQSILLNR